MDYQRPLCVCLDTIPAVQNYLASRSSWFMIKGYTPVAAVAAMSSGSTNHIYRVQFQRPSSTPSANLECKSIVLKYASNEVPLTPHINFHRERQQYEAAALREISKLTRNMSIAESLKLPALIDQDRDNSVILMEDVGAGFPPSSHQNTLTLSKFTKSAPLNPNRLGLINRVGSVLGTFLWELHSSGHSKPQQGGKSTEDLREAFAGHREARRVCAETTYGEYLSSIDSFGAQLDAEQRATIEEVMLDEKERLLSTPETLVMGDFWPGNILLTLNEHQADLAKPFILHVIDWEFVTYAPPHIDLAHFAAECWLYDHFNPSESFCISITSSLFQAYRRSGGIIDIQRVIYYIAGHIGCFLGYSTWTDDLKQRRDTATLTVSMIESAHRQDWGALRTNAFLSGLFE